MISRWLSRLVLVPDRLFCATPAVLGVEAEDVAFWAKGGVKLRGWFLRGKKSGTVVFCPGNTGNASSHLEYARIAARTGYSVLCFDYRGFGRSEGEADLRWVVRDVEAACELAAFHAREPYALFGISLGAGAALAAVGRGAADAAAVVVEGVSDIRGMLEGLFARGSFGPVRIRAVGGSNDALVPRRQPRLARFRFPWPLPAACGRFCEAFYPFEGKSVARLAAGIHSKPVFIVHGVEDQILPFEAALDFHERLRGPRRLWLIPGVGHAHEPAVACGLEYSALLEDFLDEAFTGRAGSPPAVRLADMQVHHPARGCVSIRLGLDSPSASGAEEPSGPHEPVLVSAVGGGVLRQFLLSGREEALLELPGPIEGLSTLRVPAKVDDPVARLYVSGGYRPLFREMVQAVNCRDLSRLDAALEKHLELERAYPFDFLAALEAVRAARAAMGRLASWPARDVTVARRSLERLRILWAAHPALPGEDVADSPAAWARRCLEGMVEGHTRS